MRRQLGRAMACLTLLAVLAGLWAAPASAAGFRDVPAGHWAAESIQRCAALGFFQGKSADRFGLGEEMTRSAFTVVLCRFFGWETPAPESSSFTDVSADAWYAGAVEAAYDHGAVTDQSREFRPDEAITREELAVMLVRALGYGTIAGLAQELPLPFQDVTTNAGYLTMAYDLGLMDGTSATSFSPEEPAPREQVAVILMRLYDMLHGDAPEITAVVSDAAADLTGVDMAAIPAARLLAVAGKAAVTESMAAEEAAAIRDAARTAGAKALLYVTGGTSALNGSAQEAAAALAQAVEAGGYDGVFLDLPQLREADRRDLTALAKAADDALGEKLFCLAAEAPAWTGKEYGGYDYAALAREADLLVLRIASYENQSAAFPTAPVNPLEEVYYALASLKEDVEGGKLALMLDPAVSVWNLSGSRQELMAEELAKLMETGEKHYSNRYACAYLTGESTGGEDLVAWFLDRQAVQERIQVARAFGVSRLWLPAWDASAAALTAQTD